MSSLVIFCLVAIAAVISQNAAASISSVNTDIHSLLDIIQQQYETSSESTEDDSGSSESLTPKEQAKLGNIVGLLSKLVNTENENVYTPRKKKPVSSRLPKSTSGSSSKNVDSKLAQNIAQILDQIVGNQVESKPQSSNKNYKKGVVPNRLLGNVKNSQADDDSSEDYSKVYVLLSPTAVQKSKSKGSGINELISKILSLSSTGKSTGRGEYSQSIYGELPMKSTLNKIRLARRQSSNNREWRKGNSVYAPDDDMNDEPPKRNRGGSGGLAGRTAIPYMHHRGENIYEKI